MVELKTRKFGDERFRYKDSSATIMDAKQKVAKFKKEGYKKCRITTRKRGLDIWCRKK